jgi:hypothetical protein
MEADRGARDWLDDPTNREAVRPWIQAVRRTEEG